MKKYDHKKIEKKWQDEWEKQEVYKTSDNLTKKKFYTLVEFPYPSGAGVHVGHAKGHNAVDVFARYKRMNGYNVLIPMGWDAFGLPAENFAIKNKKHPGLFTQENINNFRKQIKKFGCSFDWSREIDTTDPKYYKWTQWIFLKLFEMGLAYEKEAPINWCPSCKTGLANEEVINGKCERCDSDVEQRNMKQWFLKITDYAEKLIKDLDDVNWPEYIKTSQKNWIGKSEGAEIEFKIENSNEKIKVFTTRVDTIFGCTYVVLAPENKIIDNLKSSIKNISDVEKYIETAKNKKDLERTDLNKDKSGVKLEGVYAINPFNGEKVEVWIADYVLGSYGTGAVMAVPANDERDMEFAKKYNLTIKYTILNSPSYSYLYKINEDNSEEWRTFELTFENIKGRDDKFLSLLLAESIKDKIALLNEGYLFNCDSEYRGLDSKTAREKMIQFAEENNFGKRKINYKFRDWLFSRQRYWGEPIPIIKCPICGNVPVPEKELPLLLPDVENYEPTGTGESPLAIIDSWVNTTCPKCGADAKRETNTMPQWAGSSWYFLRYIDPNNSSTLASRDKLEHFMPVDIYFGGAEHTTVHLLYSRFWNKALYDAGVVPLSEPYKRRVQHGLIMGEDGRKMSKRWGNVINPDDVIEQYGADTMRTYIMFMGPYGEGGVWSTTAINGVNRFINRVWSLQEKVDVGVNCDSFCDDKETISLLHKTIKKVGEDIENISYHTALSQLMILLNHIYSKDKISKNLYNIYLKLLAPFAPHVTEEIWKELNPNEKSIHLQSWPEYKEELLQDNEIKFVVSINGKMRDIVNVSRDIDQENIEEILKSNEKIQKYLDGQNIKKIIFVKNKMINFVI